MSVLTCPFTLLLKVPQENVEKAKNSETNYHFSTTLTLLHHTENGHTTTQVCGITLLYFKVIYSKLKMNMCNVHYKTSMSRYKMHMHFQETRT